tara:strand:+ start:19971 stop:20840 length:870 start_codon:yes stop_codon:yes gene_type:complete
LKNKKESLIRVSASAGILFLFMSCSGTRKSLKFDDVYSLDVHIFEKKEWLDVRKNELEDLDKIVPPELKRFLKNDFQVYEKINTHYTKILNQVQEADSLISKIDDLVDKMKNNPPDSLDTVPEDTTVSYRDMIEKQAKQIGRLQLKYGKSIEKLKKGFKFDKKELVFILEECEPLKKNLYKIKYEREVISYEVEMIKKKLNDALFDNANALHNERILKIAKTVDIYLSKLDKYENFLMNIDRIAKEEAGGYVILIPEKSDSMEYMTLYEQGMEEYLDIINKIKKIIAST